MEMNNTDISSLRIKRYEDKGPSSPAKKYVLPAVIVLLILIAGYFLISGIMSPAVEVKMITAVIQTPGQANSLLTASGYVVAQRKASVASKGTGRLIFLGVVEGDQVKRNQVIARLEDSDIRAQLEEAKANLKLNLAELKSAENDYNRVTKLYKSQTVSSQEFEKAESRYNMVLASIDIAKSRVNASEVALENMLIRAPFDGTVLTKNAEVGEIVAPLGASTTSRAAVVTIADMSSLQVETDVSESNIEKIKPGMDCEIVLDAYPEKSHKGYVLKIVPTADRSKATVLVKVGFKHYDSSVLPEMSAKVSFLTKPVDSAAEEQKPALVIPMSSVRSINNKYYVYGVKEEKAVPEEVILGRRFNGYVEVSSGLNSGSRIISNLDENIKDGVRVKEVQ